MSEGRKVSGPTVSQMSVACDEVEWIWQVCGGAALLPLRRSRLLQNMPHCRVAEVNSAEG